ncbi:MAG: HEAT repeat domain-containing protein [Pirellulales bacterium]|nr:HEAT repeat domain-containing protein [Pirellulales bacterium]
MTLHPLLRVAGPCLLTIAATVQLAAAQTGQSLPETVYVSTGDNHWMHYNPMDSKVSIEAAFEVFATQLGVDTVWWRGLQTDCLLKHSVLRPQNRRYYGWVEWGRHLHGTVGVDQIAVAAARKHKIQIWGVTGLFEFGCQADTPVYGDYPYFVEDKIRVAHPEWIPLNRYGTRRQAGLLDFSYPEARKAVVDDFTSHVVETGYDGIVLFTYSESFQFRYLDEYGYSAPVVEEFRRRWGVDIRTQPFDKEAWARLKGEYVTQLLRELHAAFARHGKKICVLLEPLDVDLPMHWRPSANEHEPSAGRILIDWQTWAKEGIVDELCVFAPGNDQSLKRVVDGCRGTSVRVSTYNQAGAGLLPGVKRVTGRGQSLESVCLREPQIQKLPVDRRIELLKEGDVDARRCLLREIASGRLRAGAEKVAPLLDDPDLYIRRGALRALAALKDPAAVAAMEAALGDREHSVRLQAAESLKDVHGPDTAKKIVDVIRREGTFQFNYVVAVPTLVELAKDDMGFIVGLLTDRDCWVRRTAAFVLEATAGPDYGPAKPALIEAALHDSDPWVRELALSALGRWGRDPEVISVFFQSLEDGDNAVQVRGGARMLGRVLGSPASGATPEGRKAIDALAGLFRKYGEGCRREDADWGWRVVGNSLLAFGPEGEVRLRQMQEEADPQLAELAWRVVCMRQEMSRYCRATEDQDAALHPQWPKHVPVRAR